MEIYSPKYKRTETNPITLYSLLILILLILLATIILPEIVPNEQPPVRVRNLPNQPIISDEQPDNPQTLPIVDIRPRIKNMSRYAVALKTGKSVSSSRVPIQLVTFLKNVPNLLVIGEAPGNIGDIQIKDVYTNLYPPEVSNPRKIFKKVYQDAPFEKGQDAADIAQKLLDKRKTEETPNKIIVDTKSIGWKSDAHKNLPGFKLLYAKYPDADWYVMLDDDTYMYFDNLDSILDEYFQDSELPVYLGSPNHFVGCDGVTRMGQGPFNTKSRCAIRSWRLRNSSFARSPKTDDDSC